MNTKLQTQFNTLEKSRKALFDSLRNYPDELLNKKPGVDKWSVVQNIQHLTVSEEVSHNYLQKKTLDTSKAKNAGFKGKRTLLIVKFFFVFPFKFKAPAAVAPPDTFATLPELETKWAKLRNDSYVLIAKLSDEELEKELWKHPSAGKMNIYQMLDFFNIHFNKHRKQVERTLGMVKV